MSERQFEAAEMSGSFWERRPVLTGVLFIALMGAVGLTLATLVGERPHHRRTQWNVVTTLPPAGSGRPGGPARGEMAPTYTSPLFHNWVIVAVTDDKRKPVGHREVSLVIKGSRTAVSHGITAPDGGVVRIPVPPPIEPIYYRGELQAVLLGADDAEQILPVPPPHKGRSDLMFSVKRERRVKIVVTGCTPREDGHGRIRVRTPGLEADPRSLGYRVVGNESIIGGLRPGTRVEFVLSLPGREDAVLRLRTPRERKLFTTSLAAGDRLGTLRLRIGATPRPISVEVAAWGKSHGRAAQVVREVPIDADGKLEMHLPGMRDLRILIQDPLQPGVGLATRRAFLARGGTWDLGKIALRPLPVLCAGRVVDGDGRPIAGAEIEVIPAPATPEFPLHRAASRSGPDGHFSLQTPFVAGGFRIRARSGKLRALSPLLHQGEKDITLQLRERGLVRGIINCNEPRLAQELRVVLTPAGSPPTDAVASAAPVFKRGRGEVTLDVAPGSYQLWLLSALEAARRVEEVVVKAGETTAARTLPSLRLGEGWHRGELSIKALGRPAANARIRVALASQNAPALEVESGPFGRVIIPAPDGIPLDISVRGPKGYARTRIPRLPATIELQAWCRLTLVLEKAPKLENAWLQFELVPTDPPTNRPPAFLRPSASLLGERNRCFFPQAQPGRWTLLARRWAKSSLTPGPAVEVQQLELSKTTEVVGIHLSPRMIEALQR